ncbi:hypothetical protein V494_05469 [Pseudogymnoascus sp. VKM F-4513 (FW-928)]|nr:hypothetical protein V494_05469 [Pseudogymnoascus sp. VKM F-4513 (FW-928)]
MTAHPRLTHIHLTKTVASLGVPLVVDSEDAVGIGIVISRTEVNRDTSASSASMLLEVVDQRQNILSWQSSCVALQKGALSGTSEILLAGNQLAGIVPAVSVNAFDGVGDVLEVAASAAEGAAAAVDTETAVFEFDCGARDGGDCEEDGGEDGG